MYWWVALVVAVESFTTILTIAVWFFTQKNGVAHENAVFSPFWTSLKWTVT